jgi:peptidoglycan/LPS O-acetylase OafA/YrhL
MHIDIPSTTVDVRHKRPPLKALTSIRFFAAMHVVLFHMQVGVHVSRVPLVANFMASGFTGVTLFFVLSGFILAYNYPEVRRPKEFWIARFARIYPVYALSLGLSLLRPVVWHAPHPVAGLLLDFGLLQAWWIPLFSAINSAAWTLSVEAFFYAMFPVLLPWLRRMPVRMFCVLQAGYFLFVCAPPLLGLTRFAHQGLQLANLMEGPFPLFRLNTFVLGVFVGTRYLARLRDRETAPQTCQIARSGADNLRLAGSVLCSAALLCLAPSAAWLPLRTLLLSYTYVWAIVELAEVAWPVLTNHWMQVAGEISYGIYILQFPVGLMTAGVWRRLIPGMTNFVLPSVAAILVAAYVSFRWFETPARLTLRRILTGKPVPVRTV